MNQEKTLAELSLLKVDLNLKTRKAYISLAWLLAWIGYAIFVYNYLQTPFSLICVGFLVGVESAKLLQMLKDLEKAKKALQAFSRA